MTIQNKSSHFTIRDQYGSIRDRLESLAIEVSALEQRQVSRTEVLRRLLDAVAANPKKLARKS